jgi:hypothetical protein
MHYQLGLLLDTEELNSLHAVYAYPLLSLCAQYLKKHNKLGHCCAMLKTGNKEAERMVRGQLVAHIALLCVVNPSASIDEAREFLYNVDPMLGVPFCPAAVVEADHLLGLRRKLSYTTCKRPFLPLNKHRRFVFWNQIYPLG